MFFIKLRRISCWVPEVVWTPSQWWRIPPSTAVLGTCSTKRDQKTIATIIKLYSFPLIDVFLYKMSMLQQKTPNNPKPYPNRLLPIPSNHHQCPHLSRGKSRPGSYSCSGSGARSSPGPSAWALRSISHGEWPSCRRTALWLRRIVAGGEPGHAGMSESAFLLLELFILLKVMHFHGNKAIWGNSISQKIPFTITMSFWWRYFLHSSN